MRGIAFRRHTDSVAKARAARRLKLFFSLRRPMDAPEDPDPKQIGLHARTPVACSCPACGNPRRHFGEQTMAERRACMREKQHA